jgi:hypothetical protein
LCRRLPLHLQKNASQPPKSVLPGIQRIQESVMQDAIVGSWAAQPHFSVAMLDSLHDLNHRFLDLVGGRGAGWQTANTAGPNAAGLCEEISLQVAPLSATQRAAAAHCPYALFDLKFYDHDYWGARLQQPGYWRVADEAIAADDTASFVRLALFYAWHVAATERLSGQLLLGMSAHTAAAFRRATLNSLPALVAGEAANLCARWRTCNAYWRALVRAAAHADAERLRRVQLFGLQLEAAARLP